MSAVLSDDRVYRYRLDRDLAGWPPPDLFAEAAGGGAEPVRCVFIMLNPSTADATTNDRTVNRCIGYAEREGCTHLTIVNLYAYRTAYPEKLDEAAVAGVDIVGPDADRHVTEALTGAALTVAAWGAHVPGKRGGDARAARRAHDARVGQMRAIALECGAELRSLGQTAGGCPPHPLYLSRELPFTPWPRP